MIWRMLNRLPADNGQECQAQSLKSQFSREPGAACCSSRLASLHMGSSERGQTSPAKPPAHTAAARCAQKTTPSQSFTETALLKHPLCLCNCWFVSVGCFCLDLTYLWNINCWTVLSSCAEVKMTQHGIGFEFRAIHKTWFMSSNSVWDWSGV